MNSDWLKMRQEAIWKIDKIQSELQRTRQTDELKATLEARAYILSTYLSVTNMSPRAFEIYNRVMNEVARDLKWSHDDE